jgi:hypothetical protein
MILPMAPSPTKRGLIVLNLRFYRGLVAVVLALAAVGVSPTNSRADISILVQEIDSGGGVVQTLGLFSNVGNFINTGAASTNSFDIANISSFLSSNGTFGSLTTTFNLVVGSNYVQADGHGLKFTITATGAINNFPDSPGTFTNNAGASSAIAGTGGLNNIAGINEVTSTTTVEGVTTAPSTDSRGDGSVVFPPSTTTIGNVANLPHPYSIIQTVVVRAIPVNSSAIISSGATFGGSASSTVTANPVPAPGGLLLALIALPVLGARRFMCSRKM